MIPQEPHTCCVPAATVSILPPPPPFPPSETGKKKMRMCKVLSTSCSSSLFTHFQRHVQLLCVVYAFTLNIEMNLIPPLIMITVRVVEALQHIDRL